jgi:predicted  nucleic acid-binding Zn-ribbon protein
LKKIKLSSKAPLVWLYLQHCSQLTELTGVENCLGLQEVNVISCPRLKLLTFLEAWKEEIQNLKSQLADYEQPESDPEETLNAKIQRKKQALQRAVTGNRSSTKYLRQQEEQINAKQEQITQLQSQTQQKQTRITQLEGQIRDLNAEKQAIQEKMLAERQEALAE